VVGRRTYAAHCSTKPYTAEGSRPFGPGYRVPRGRWAVRARRRADLGYNRPAMNRLYYGDNLDVLRRHVDSR
jgi:hypothetical protein